MEITKPRGTNDFFAPKSQVFERIQELAGEVVRSFGFRPIITPIFEATELFKRNLGETSDVVTKEMYTFQDRGDRSLTLRPEGTAPVVRCLVENSLLQAGIDRVYYIGPMFRYERPQAGRYRQHHQVGVEAFGDKSPEVDAEVIACFVAILRRLGLEDVRVKIHTVGVPESRARFGAALKAALLPKKPQLCTACHDRLERNPMRILDCKTEGCRKALADAPRFLDFLDPADREHFEAVQAALRDHGVDYEIDPYLVRGFDYYTRTAFEVVSTRLGAQDAVGGGGRYDLLVQELGGPATPAVGFGCGIERLMLLLEEYGLAVPPRPGPRLVYLVVTDPPALAEARRLARDLRAAGIPVRMHSAPDKPGKQMKVADRLGASHAVLLGERERSAGTVTLKDMATGDQQMVAPAELAKKLGSPG